MAASFEGEAPGTLRESFALTADHPVLRDHKVFGQSLLPGLAYLDLLYQTFREHGFAFESLQLRNLAIYYPMRVEEALWVTIECAPIRSGVWRVEVFAEEQRGGASVGTRRRYCSADMGTTSPTEFAERLDVARIREQVHGSIPLNHVYAECVRRELVHGSSMRANGVRYETDDAVYIDCALNEQEQQNAVDSMFHPALVDVSAIAVGELAEATAGEAPSLVLPMFYESFRASALIQQRCVTRVLKSSLQAHKDLYSATLEFFDERGHKIAELTRLAGKAVREPGLIDPARRSAQPAAMKVVELKALSARRQATDPPAARSSLVDRLRDLITAAIAERLRRPVSAIPADVGYYEMGLDSAQLLDLVRLIESEVGASLSPTLMFEHTTIAELTEHLALTHGAELRLRDEVTLPARGEPVETDSAPQQRMDSEAGPEPIAIIGMAGRFPGARDTRELWSHLLSGEDCITEVPAARWDWHLLERLKSPSGKPMSRWGGFIEDADCFDAQFFRVTPRDAEALDPQERQFLEVCWETLEDAGYTPENVVEARGASNRRNVGVFAGVMHKDYSLVAAQSLKEGQLTSLPLSNAPIANRVSYFCNFHGPSVVVDTLCSSSLVAIHMAMESLRQKGCDVALAGGVNLSLHPAKYLSYGLADLHSSDGRCRSFGKGGDGYVSAEAVGAVLLKPLRKALESGDHVYAVIRAGSTNHVGTVSGMAVPSPVAQADVIDQCLQACAIDPRTISYVEAHGTGTLLGDPIEIEGLSKAWRRYTDDAQFCAIGSLKSNIGHAEAAAGVAGLIKVALQLKHATLTASLHAGEPNPFIDWKQSPFFIQSRTEPWPSQRALLDGRQIAQPRRAALSSFGATGSNVHLILEELCEHGESPAQPHPVVVALSARSEAGLHEYAQRLFEFVRTPEVDLVRLAFTLQVGRQAFDFRAAWIVNSIEALRQQLEAFIERKPATPSRFVNQVRHNNSSLGMFAADEDSAELIEKWLAKGKLEKLAEAWTQGLEVRWERSYGTNRPKRISLPTYPFARERHWVATGATPVVESSARLAADAQTILLRPRWQRSDGNSTAARQEERRWVFLCGDGTTYEETRAILAERSPEVRCEILETPPSDVAARYETVGWQLLRRVQEILHTHPSTQVLVQVVIGQGAEASLSTAFGALLKTAQQENPHVRGQVVSLEPSDGPQEWARKLADDSATDDVEIRYRDGLRQALTFEALPHIGPTPRAETPGGVARLPWRAGGVYLITGGAGGLGLIFANAIARGAARPKLLLTGRSGLDARKERALEDLRALGADAQYYSVDVADRVSVQKLLAHIEERHGPLNGVIHSAGVLRDSFLLKKSAEEYRAVLAPKVRGVVNLDEALGERELDFFVLFSSGTGSFGNAGQADYAMANAFLDRYAHYREELVSQGRRKGRTLSVGWPLWQQGGMRMPDAQRNWLRQQGLAELGTDEGIEAFLQAVASDCAQVQVLRTLPARHAGAPLTLPQKQEEQEPPLEVDRLNERVLNQLRSLLSEATKLGFDRIDTSVPLESYGIDSVMIMRLNSRLAEVFGRLSKTLFFEFPTLEQVRDYLVGNHRTGCVKWCAMQTVSATQARALPGVQEGAARGSSPSREAAGADRSTDNRGHQPLETSGEHAREPIAIIGLSARYAQAPDARTFWENLREGKDCIAEVPADRWPLEGFYHPDPAQASALGKSYSKWGGFLDGFAEFDPLFFNITPRDALSMDPQERIFIQSCWQVLEDAGYTRERLATRHQRRVGVFAGITKTGFELYGPELWRRGERQVPQTSFSSLANRVSYVLNLQGPSMPIDTMCSASLTAIHEACEHLLRGECELAIAGGVNLYLHPINYTLMCAASMLSAQGRCKSFGHGGDGLVPGEGVGAVLLKPLSRAVADQDPIHGLILGTSINHGGKTNGYTVPNPTAQSELIRTALRKAGVNARAVSYIEAHGTGTELGDPIEITGLTQAFAPDTSDVQFCAIGSVKTNIGHCESAAGIAGLTKVLLQMKHAQLVPSLHARQPNPHIDFGNTPFRVQQASCPWQRPLVMVDGQTREYPRIAGVSSFGAGGANAHVILQEYVSDPDDESVQVSSDRPAIIVLSGRTAEALQGRMQQLLQAIGSADYCDSDLASIAYTLQVGREAMEHRLAFTAANLEELRHKLHACVAGEPGVECYRGEIKRNKEALSAFTADEDLQQAIEAWVQKGKYARLMDLWVKGLVFDWQRLYDGSPPRRLSLPTYPFARVRYWIPLEPGVPEGAASAVASVLHPLVHTNSSGFDEQRFSSKLSGTEWFLSDHRVEGAKVLPGVAYLEMARVALEQSLRAADRISGVVLKNVVWMRPLKVEGTQSVHIGLNVNDIGEIDYEVYSGDDVLHGQGRALVREGQSAEPLDLRALRTQCDHTLEGKLCYELFDQVGLQYGPAHQGLQSVSSGMTAKGERFVLAEIRLPSCVGETRERYGLHPSVMDAALQGCIGMALGRSDAPGVLKPALPFALDELQILDRTPEHAYAYIRQTQASVAMPEQLQKLDIDVCDAQGRVCVRMKGFTGRTLDERINSGPEETLFLRREWQAQPVVGAADAGAQGGHWLLVDAAFESSIGALRARWPEAACEVLPAPSGGPGDLFTVHATQLFELTRRLLIRQPRSSVPLQIVLAEETEHTGLLGALAGLLKSARQEHPLVAGQLIVVSRHTAPQALIACLEENANSRLDTEVRYRNGERHVARYSMLPESRRPAGSPWKDHGVYLITGGAGGLGYLLAEHLAARVSGARLILTGRSALSSGRRAELAALQERSGARIEYRQVDVSDATAVNECVVDIVGIYGCLNGVIHCAGVLKDSLLTKKTVEDLHAVLAPKVDGTVNLDRATEHLALDCFILYSSIAGALGNTGQADYALGNAFMNEYARYRNELVRRGVRRGKTLAVGWPLWKDGGMQVNAVTLEQMQLGGFALLEREDGMAALYRAWNDEEEAPVVLRGNARRLTQVLLQPAAPAPAALTSPEPRESAVDRGERVCEIEQAVIREISEVIQVSSQDVDVDTELSELGFDSISFTALSNALNRAYRLDLAPTLFFEYPTVHRLAQYLAQVHVEAFASPAATFATAGLQAGQFQPEKTHSTDPPANRPRVESRRRGRRTPVAPASAASQTSETARRLDPIAIVGMSGRFPGSPDLDAYWKNLSSGTDCIQEIPTSRWDWRALHGDPLKGGNRTDIKWGGFIAGIDEFDPLFFSISPREAEWMDPQQRLLLMFAWQAIEDAGYAPHSLAGSRTAVLIGMGTSTYWEVIAQCRVPVEGVSVTAMAASIGPNRLSHFLDVHGPSEPIDTACSSSLVALHRAVRAIQSDDCDAALVGGISTLLTPGGHISFSKAGMLSEDGRCKTFSKDANGYVRGEGVGMLFLKRLSAAERDGDHVYAVIKGSAENHGGRATSLTAPNPKAQAQLIKAAYVESGIDARTISYIETHGTGTPLGDPVEINGLKSAFADLCESAAPAAYCGLGSVKSNIGHLEFAAGIASVIKVLLQIKHRTVVRSLHCEEINPYIQLEGSPFYLVRQSAPWSRLRDESGMEVPRRAGVSSFGFGGANAHVILEEYAASAPVAVEGLGPEFVIVLSAKTEKALQAQVNQWIHALEQGGFAAGDLASIAYTLQVGREAMEHRLAFTAASLAELHQKLRACAAGEPGRDCHRGEVKRNKEALAAFTADEDLQQAIEAWVQKGKYAKLMDLWVKGLVFDWQRLYGPTRPRRLSLPTYPFARDRYWPLEPAVAGGAVSAEVSAPGVEAPVSVHPLVHANTSSFDAQRFSSKLSGQEWFLSDHQVLGARVLPGVAYLEMARAAVERSVGAAPAEAVPGLVLKNVVWMRPLVVEGPQSVHIALSVNDSGEIDYEVYSGEDTVHSQGRAVLRKSDSIEPLNLNALQSQCDRTFEGTFCYELFDRAGLRYGPAHQGLQSLGSGIDEQGQSFVLAQIRLPACVGETRERYGLHPSVMDAALQGCIGLGLGRSGADEIGELKPGLPFELDELQILGRTPEHAYAYIRHSRSSKLDIDLCDSQGRVCVRMKGFVMRGTEPADTAEPSSGSMTLMPSWDATQQPHGEPWPPPPAHIAVIGGTLQQQRDLKERYANLSVLSTPLQAPLESIVATLEAQIAARGRLEHLVWIAPHSCADELDPDRVIAGQESGVLSLFRVTKALLQLGYGTRNLGLTVVTWQAQGIDARDVDPTHAGVHGLSGSLAKELSSWKVRLVDLPRASQWPLEQMLRLPSDPQGNAWLCRFGEWHRERLLSCAVTSAARPPYRCKGVYVVIGGAGGIGEVFSEYLIRHYDARVIWIGRRKLDADIVARQARMSELGQPPQYIRADATSHEELLRAYHQIKENHPQIHGVIHSAIVLCDKSLVNMDEGVFRAGLAAKVDVSVRLAQVFGAESLDFALFFSSMQSFTKAAGQSNYAAGCTFKDAFAKSLSARWRCPVKVMNWGYWGSIGIVASPIQQKRMEQAGIGSIEPGQALSALEHLLAGPYPQLALIQLARPQATSDLGEDESVMSLSDDAPSVLHEIQAELAGAMSGD